MIARLPRWVWSGAAVLSFCAGMVNVIALLGFTHEAATHVTGICSRFSIALLEGSRRGMFQTSLIVGSFFFGALAAGAIIRDARLRLGRRYGFALLMESALLFASAYGFVKGHAYGEYFASMAAGLQNAMASTYSDAIVRTTHLTGVLTDLGALAGNRLGGIPVDTKRLKLLSAIFFSFLAGGLFGAFCYRALSSRAMLVPACIIGASAVFYELFRRSKISLG